MTAYPRSRLAIAAVFLAFQILLFSTQCIVDHLGLFKDPKTNKQKRVKTVKSWLVFFHYLVFPVFVGILGIAFTLVMFNGNYGDGVNCEAKIDTDIVGPGIRIAQWVQLAVLFTFAVLGTFHTHATGVKEIGAGLTVIHLSLAIALLVGIKGGISTTNAILGAMILDSQNSAISIQMITKETLASRFQILAVLPCQTLGLIVEAVLVRGFRQKWFGFEKENCDCVGVTWWGRLSSCKGDQKHLSDQEMIIFWTYFSCRVVAFVQSSYHALMDTFKFHYAEIESRERNLRQPITENIELRANLRHATFAPQGSSSTPSRFVDLDEFVRWITRDKKRKGKYDDFPSTLSLTYLTNGVFSVGSMAAVEAAIDGEGGFGGKEEEGVKWSTGQVIAVVVAAVSIIRGIWHFVRIFKQGEKFVFTWRSIIPGRR